MPAYRLTHESVNSVSWPERFDIEMPLIGEPPAAVTGMDRGSYRAAVSEILEWLRGRYGPGWESREPLLPEHRWIMINFTLFMRTPDEAFEFKMRWG